MKYLSIGKITSMSCTTECNRFQEKCSVHFIKCNVQTTKLTRHVHVIRTHEKSCIKKYLSVNMVRTYESSNPKKTRSEVVKMYF